MHLPPAPPALGDDMTCSSGASEPRRHQRRRETASPAVQGAERERGSVDLLPLRGGEVGMPATVRGGEERNEGLAASPGR
jgi:hypothetical protein